MGIARWLRSGLRVESTLRDTNGKARDNLVVSMARSQQLRPSLYPHSETRPRGYKKLDPT